MPECAPDRPARPPRRFDDAPQARICVNETAAAVDHQVHLCPRDLAQQHIAELNVGGDLEESEEFTLDPATVGAA
jgi:hypothetical protein